ncbi:MAG: bifunctional demethylmenaquinone methyltransferase/2-methoxy-6-polyprenyl-1,4-benzoquinol methylase UbiE [Candidatus Brocadiia bacterium]|nr:MAG: bifunctional demethylmenaquinone methyltransferase/2-methoxy-6-polyprenyl-1,4-benzoquinol methylase UbiE [Candidatus Brocadiia bacterium]
MNEAAIEKKGISKQFDRIAASYDLGNRAISFGMDLRWRRKLISLIEPKAGLEILDVATGTGDVAIMAAKRLTGIKRLVGCDLSQEMLRIAGDRAAREKSDRAIGFTVGDMHNLPFEDEVFDYVTISFGLRNSHEIERAVSEIRRVLRAGGKALILECSMPENRVFRVLFSFYFRYIMPLIGGAVSGDRKAYLYLNRSVETFNSAKANIAMLQEAGFETKTISFAFGTVWIYAAEKRR